MGSLVGCGGGRSFIWSLLGLNLALVLVIDMLDVPLAQGISFLL
jgi:hypothetical protein